MRTRPHLAPLLLILAGATLFLSTSHADEPAFKQKALVGGLSSTHGDPCKGGQGGQEFDHWKLGLGSTEFKINNRSGNRHYIDLLWRWPHELQDPDMHVINKGKPLVATDICKPAADKIEDHLFLFAIHNLKDPATKVKGPHALLYAPMKLGTTATPYVGDQFYLFIFNIADDSVQCMAVIDDSIRERCLALRRLFVKNVAYLTKEIDEIQLTKAIHDEVGKLIPDASAFAAAGTVSTLGIESVLLHNGIIHGTLGGG